MGELLKNIRGFTLIEMSIILMVAGLISVPLIMQYNVTVQKLKISDTDANLSQVNDFLDLYVQKNGEYPLPAPLHLPPEHADYGKSTIAGLVSCNNVNWKTTTGVCRTTGPADEQIVMGAVPYITLGAPEEITYDYWKRKVLYAVTLDQTNIATYTEDGGEIRMRALDDFRNLTDIGTDYDAVILSMGDRGNGAFTKDGVEVAPCLGMPNDQTTPLLPNPLTDNIRYENENCDFDNVFLLDKNVSETDGSAEGTRVMINSAEYFDDVTRAVQTTSAQTWFAHANDGGYAITMADRVGVGTTSPQERVHVVGDIQAEDDGTGTSGNVLAPEFCDNSNNCFNPELIAGRLNTTTSNIETIPEADCRLNTPLAGNVPVLQIGEGRLKCATPIFDATLSNIDADGAALEFDPVIFNHTDCSLTNRLMRGVDINGNINCETP